MADTRKDRRAPVSLKVRFKSATVDEFIEQYAVDISRGGIFIKSKSPMAVGTLLKFEFQLKDESRLIHGVGRVVWRREPAEAGEDSPPGMGIKFIKMDPQSRALVEKIVSSRGNEVGQFERGTGSVQKVAPRKKTEPFFPAASGPADLPAPEDRTQVRHASEFLASALSGADEDAAAEAEAKAEEARRRTDEIQRRRVEEADQHKKEQEARERAEKEARERSKQQLADAAALAASEPPIDIDEPAASPVGLAGVAALEAEVNSDIDSLLEDELTVQAPALSESMAERERLLDEDEIETQVAPVEHLLGKAASDAGESSDPLGELTAPLPSPNLPKAAALPSAPVADRMAAEARAEKPRSVALPVAIAAIAVTVIGYFVYTNVIAPPVAEQPTEIATAPDTVPDPEETSADVVEDLAVDPVEGETEPIIEGPTAAVRVESTPPGARVTVNGAARGVTPVEVQLPLEEEVSLAIRLAGYGEDVRDVVGEEGMTPIRVRLQEFPYVIAVESTPPGARVTALGRRTTAPGELLISRPTGPITIQASLAGFERTTESVAADSFEERDGRMVRVLAITLPERARPTPAAGGDSRPTMASTMMTEMVADPPPPDNGDEPDMEATMEATMDEPPPDDPPPPPDDPPDNPYGVPDNPF